MSPAKVSVYLSRILYLPLDAPMRAATTLERVSTDPFTHTVNTHTQANTHKHTLGRWAMIPAVE